MASAMGHLQIEVTRQNGKLVASPRVPRGGTVTWIFKGELAQEQLQVRHKDDHSITFSTRPLPDRISDTPFPIGGTAGSFRYEIIDDQGVPLPWADGDNGECIDPQDPP